MRTMARRHGWSLQVTGIGGKAVTAAVNAATPNAPVILAGVAGALRGAPFTKVREVVTANSVLTSPLLDEGIRVTQADGIVATPEDKAALAELTGADIVDMESTAFAIAAEASGRPWAIFRGVSDGIEHSLPPGCDQWFDAQGGIRPLRAALDLVKNPADLLHILQFARRTRHAMHAVAKLTAQHAATIQEAVQD